MKESKHDSRLGGSEAVGATWQITGGATRRWGGGRRAGPVPLYSCGLRDTWQRESGRRAPVSFARAAAGSHPLVSRLALTSVLASHHGCVNTVAFTPSGQRLLSGSDDQRIVLWDWAKGAEVLKWRSGHGNNVFQARALPCSNERTVVTCAADGQVRVSLLSESASVTTRRLARHRGRAHKLAVLADSPFCFLSCGEDGLVLHFDLRARHPSTRVLTVHCAHRMRAAQPLGLNAVAANPARPHLFALGGADEFARVYDLRRCMARAPSPAPDSRAFPVETFAPPHLVKTNRDRLRPPVHITCVAYSPHDELLASYNDELIYLYHPHHSLGPDPLSLPAARRSRGFQVLSSASSGGTGGSKSKGSGRRRVMGSSEGDWGVWDRSSRGESSSSGDGRLDGGGVGGGGGGNGDGGGAAAAPAAPGDGSTAITHRRLTWLQRTFHSPSAGGSATAAATPSGAAGAAANASASGNAAAVGETAGRDGRGEGGGRCSKEQEDGGARDMEDERRREEGETAVEVPERSSRGRSGEGRSGEGRSGEGTSGEERYRMEVDAIGYVSGMMRGSRDGARGVGREGQEAEQGGEQEEEEEDEEGVIAYGDRIEVYSGHRNEKTVKGVAFFGLRCEYVVSGSDCGHVFVWRKVGGRLVAMMPGDAHVVNCLEPHPSATILATSGIESTVKIWAPTAQAPKGLPSNAQRIMESNKRRREQPFGVPRMAADVEVPRLRLQRQHGQLMGQDRVATFGSLLRRVVGNGGGGGGGDGNDGGIGNGARNGGGSDTEPSAAEDGGAEGSLREALIAGLGERAGIRDLFPFEEDYSEDESEELEEGEVREGEDDEDEDDRGGGHRWSRAGRPECRVS
ncbi:hypothetical protein CLOM_g11907 [Closterium sp. NIES-68]|nr:hypothetical protein CLOM_g11907 [Closterium sp. NIES-68]